MTMQRLNVISGRLLIFLSAIGLLTVISGYFQTPQADEGAGAHIFQFSVVAFLPAIIVFLATADWKRMQQTLRPLLVSVTALGLAFAALYYLEHYFHVQR